MPTVRYTVVDGEMIAEERGGVRRQFVPDPLGSTVALLDNSQTKTDTFAHWPYGEEQSRTGKTNTPFRFVGTMGYYRDDDSLIYVRARHFNTLLGKWVAIDPIESSYNWYEYCADDPAGCTDPLGLQDRPWQKFYDDPRAAAIAILRYTYATYHDKTKPSFSSNEWAGEIKFHFVGTTWYSLPTTSNNSILFPVPVIKFQPTPPREYNPTDSAIVIYEGVFAGYHTHPPTGRSVDELFSWGDGSDLDTARKERIVIYLGTPTLVKEYNPRTNLVTILSPIR